MHVPHLSHLATADPQLAGLIEDEATRQHDKLRMIASENYVSAAVLEATGTVLTNKYSEGYAGKRYYEGQQFVDPKKLHIVGIFPNYEEAKKAWRGATGATIDDAHMRYFIVHLHRFLDPANEGHDHHH